VAREKITPHRSGEALGTSTSHQELWCLHQKHREVILRWAIHMIGRGKDRSRLHHKIAPSLLLIHLQEMIDGRVILMHQLAKDNSGACFLSINH
jgi:hypothetical protein